MRVQAAAVKSGGDGSDQPQLWALAALFIDHVLRIIEAAAALNLAAEAGVSGLWRARAPGGGIADLILGQAVADTHDH
jgi:hypothetical protein